MGIDMRPWSVPQPTAEFEALERVSVLVERTANWSPRYAWKLGRRARQHADLCGDNFRCGIEIVLITHDDASALAGWHGQPQPEEAFEARLQEQESEEYAAAEDCAPQEEGMGKLKAHPFDATKFLTTLEAQLEFLVAAFETGDETFIDHCLEEVIFARRRVVPERSAALEPEG